jgi:ParB-like chromosome segregation protein Spo0J
MTKGKFREVNLADLKPNPFRDFKVDPISEEGVEAVAASIGQSGFWSGVTARKNGNGDLEIGAGHTRIEAAKRQGISKTTICVVDFSDAEMIRAYASENSTQRGANVALGTAGATISAIKYIAIALLRDDKKALAGIQASEHGCQKALESLQVDGVGWRMILNFYEGVDGITKNVVIEHLANLKASGDYARTINEATEEVEREHAEELAELERQKKEAEEKAEADKAAKLAKAKAKAEEKAAKAKETGKKAKEAAGKKPKTFDLAAVGQYLTTQHQLKTFRDIVQRDSVRQHLPVSKHAELAKAIAECAKEKNEELSGAFIREYINNLIYGVLSDEKKADKTAVKEMEREDAYEKWRNTSHHLCRNIAGVALDAKTMLELKNKYSDFPFTITQELRRAVSYAYPVINQLAAKLGI